MMDVFFKDGLLRFDGAILELFSEKGGSTRYHVRYVKKIELVQRRKDFILMNLDYGKGGGFSGYIVLPESVEQARQIIAAVESAKQAF